MEDLIKQAGYHKAVLLLLITPILWAFPVTLMVSEMSAALPEDGGYYVWVRRAMGPFWGFQEAWLSLAASIFDMALYPTMFIIYLSRLWPAAGGSTLSIWVGIGLIALCVVMNLAGIRSIGAGSLALSLVLLLPFVVMVGLLVFHHPSSTPAAPTQDGPWLGGILVVMWNYMGWDNTSTVAGEIDRPQRTYPMAMFISVILVALTYVIPVAVAARTGFAASDWSSDTGTWVDAGRTAGGLIGPHLGRVLAIAIMSAGMISAFAMFNSLILSYSRLPIAMAADGFLPKVLALRTRTGAPWVAILICAVGWGLCIRLGFSKLVLLDTIMYGLSLILEFAALIMLRIREPNLPRAYKVPGGLIGCTLVGLGPIIIMAVAFHHALQEALSDQSARKCLITVGCLTAAGVVLYIAARLINPRAGKPHQPGMCDRCGYLLQGLTTARCPECGLAFDVLEPEQLP